MRVARVDCYFELRLLTCLCLFSPVHRHHKHNTLTLKPESWANSIAWQPEVALPLSLSLLDSSNRPATRAKWPKAKESWTYERTRIYIYICGRQKRAASAQRIILVIIKFNYGQQLLCLLTRSSVALTRDSRVDQFVALFGNVCSNSKSKFESVPRKPTIFWLLTKILTCKNHSSSCV